MNNEFSSETPSEIEVTINPTDIFNPTLLKVFGKKYSYSKNSGIGCESKKDIKVVLDGKKLSGARFINRYLIDELNGINFHEVNEPITKNFMMDTTIKTIELDFDEVLEVNIFGNVRNSTHHFTMDNMTYSHKGENKYKLNKNYKGVKYTLMGTPIKFNDLFKEYLLFQFKKSMDGMGFNGRSTERFKLSPKTEIEE